MSGSERDTRYFDPTLRPGCWPSGSRSGPGASDWSGVINTVILLAVNGDLIRHLPAALTTSTQQDQDDWQEDLLSSDCRQTGSFYRYFHQSLSFGISDDNHDEVCWVEILSVIPGQAGDQGETLLRVSQRTGQIKTKDVIQEFHPVGFNNKEVKTPELIINDRSVLVLPLFPLDTGMVTHPVLVFTMFQVWQLFCS